MTQLTWAKASDRIFETGLDRGVLYLKDGSAASWSGLTSVEEQGSEGVEEYYIDGQPFLFLPKRKQFSATIRAYTYPDEFSSVMGLVEVADGFYLDSQSAEAFDLSYRTMVGNLSGGSTAAYKIHLVYNAVVVPPDASYETLGESVNPVDFSWDIRAVPTELIGYYPTAHAIIDSRKVDPQRLSQVEALLYGNSTTTPKMPTLKELSDILGLGDEVIVTDNLDGTWTVEGSNENIDKFLNRHFEIRNIESQDLGDGVYLLASTGENIPDQNLVDGGSPNSESSTEPYDGGMLMLDGGSDSDESSEVLDGGNVDEPTTYTIEGGLMAESGEIEEDELDGGAP